MPPARSRVEITLAFWMATNVEDDPGACIPDFLEDSPALGHAATARRARAFHRFRHEFSRVSILAAVRRTFGRWVERTCPRRTPEFQKNRGVLLPGRKSWNSDSEGTEGGPKRQGRPATRAGSARSAAAQQRPGVGHPGIRQTPQAERGHAERRGPSLPGHVCQFEEDLPQAGGALLGLSARSSSRAGQDPPPRRPDPPESTAEHRLQPPSRARQLKDQRARFTYEKSFQSRGQDEAARRHRRPSNQGY